MYKKYHAQKGRKICSGCRVSAAKIYLYHSTKISKGRPHRVEWQTFANNGQRRNEIFFLLSILP